MRKTILSFVVSLPALALAQEYSIDRHTVAGGSANSANGQYALSGTIGQADAVGPLAAGNYSLTGGFWSLLFTVQTPGAPTLFIAQVGDAVIVSWQDISGWVLQQNTSVASPGGWTISGGVTTVNGTNYLDIVSPTGSLFFRLARH